MQVIRPSDGACLRTTGSEGSGAGHFDSPHGVAFDGAGHIIVADSLNHRVQVLRCSDGSHVRTIGSQGSGNGHFRFALRRFDRRPRAHHRERVLQSSHTGAAVSSRPLRALRSVKLTFAAVAAWFRWAAVGGRCSPTLLFRWLGGCVLRADANAIASGRCEGREGVYTWGGGAGAGRHGSAVCRRAAGAAGTRLGPPPYRPRNHHQLHS